MPMAAIDSARFTAVVVFPVPFTPTTSTTPGRPSRVSSALNGRSMPASVSQAMIDAAKNKWLRAIRGALSAKPVKGRITVSGYEGSELLDSNY